MRVIVLENISVYVYREIGERHKMPHCHVRTSIGEETVVALPTMEIIVGADLSREAMDMLIGNLEQICDAWDHINPEVRT